MIVLRTACLALVLVAGCAVVPPILRAGAPVEIIRGTDSAGAVIELEKQGTDFVAARVIDVVLGTGEGEIVSTPEGIVEFTIEFPAGATITYRGSVSPQHTSSTLALRGSWAQLAGGIFAEDSGTWAVTSQISNE